MIAGAMTSAPGALTRGRVGMACLIGAESTFFSVLVVAYLYYIGKSVSGPQPAEVLDLPLAASAALLSSSATVTLAVRALGKGRRGTFLAAWGATIALGAWFLSATAVEWHRLIFEDGLTISTNLFGSTYYTLVGFHAGHVTVGVVLLTLVWVLGLRGHVRREHAERVELLSWYWHFVDAVWVVVFTVVYVMGR